MRRQLGPRHLSLLARDIPGVPYLVEPPEVDIVGDVAQKRGQPWHQVARERVFWRARVVPERFEAVSNDV